MTATYQASEDRLKLLLRDPDFAIWDRDMIMRLFNEAQLEIQQKTGVLEAVEAHRYPPFYDYCYLFGWEYTFTEGDRIQVLAAYQPTADRVITYAWEAFYWGSSVETTSSGYTSTIPWEGALYLTHEILPIPVPAKLNKMKLCAWNNEKIEPQTESYISRMDRFYKSTKGAPVYYWRPDDYHHHMALYPLPGTITWQDLPAEEEIMADDGGMAEIESLLDIADVGISVDEIDTDDALFMIFDVLPVEIEAVGDDIESWEPWMVKYIEYATLERAYGADTDGHIPSLRDYWKMRKEIGIEALKRYRRMKMGDRSIRIGNGRTRIGKSRLRLPEHYPAV